MSPEHFIQEFAEILEVSSSDISMETALADLAVWDSVNVLGYMMLVDEQTGRQVDPDKVKDAVTIGDLYALALG